jgi:hypothetical protein
MFEPVEGGIDRPLWKGERAAAALAQALDQCVAVAGAALELCEQQEVEVPSGSFDT